MQARRLAPKRGKGYYKPNALNTTHTRQILSYPGMDSPKHFAIHSATNRVAKPGDPIRTMRGGPSAATARQVPISTQIPYLFCQDGTCINVCCTTAGKKLVETCSLVLNMHVALLTTPSLRNISITHSVSLGKGWESFLNSSGRDAAPQGPGSG